jgi:tRNA(His) 5'-end guanylyltransferase
MIDTTLHLVRETQALIGYTQSDEISLVWYLPEESFGQYMFDGRYQKLSSVLAGMASGFFVRELPSRIPEKDGELPMFDCRVWQVPSLEEAYHTLLWREQDAVKNSITMAALAHFPYKELQGVNGISKQDMLQAIGQPYHEMPAKFRRGTYVQRVIEKRMLSDEEKATIPEKYWPTSPVERASVKTVNLPEIKDREKLPLKLFFPTVFQQEC